jgi:C1A family cysteine protease
MPPKADHFRHGRIVQSGESQTESEKNEDGIQTKQGPHPEDEEIELKPYVNWYKDGFVSSPYDQGRCGGCWAFSTAAAVESLCKI